MDDDAPDLVMRLYWDCQKLQERLNQLPYEKKAREGAILTFLGQMEAKYPNTIPEFQPEISWFNVAQPVNMDSLRGTLPLLDFFTYCCVNCHHILPGWEPFLIDYKQKCQMKFTDLAKLEEKWSERGLAVVGVHRHLLFLLTPFQRMAQESTLLTCFFSVPSLNTNGRMTMCDTLSKGLCPKTTHIHKILRQQNQY